MNSSSIWRLMTAKNIPAVLEIADQVHPDFPEDITVFAERQRLYPAGAYVLERDMRICGYLISHPWTFGTPPSLNRLLGAIPQSANTFYLHDLALLPGERGTGMAGAIVEQIAAYARGEGFLTMSLIAVNGSIPFWQRRAFVVDESAQASDYVRSYDDMARLMVRSLA